MPVSMSVTKLAEQAIVDYFERKGQYYDPAGNILLMDGTTWYDSPLFAKQTRPRNGPKSGRPFSAKHCKILEEYNTSNALHHQESRPSQLLKSQLAILQ